MLDKKMIAKEDIKFGFIAAAFLSFFEIIILAVINSYTDETFDSLSTMADQRKFEAEFRALTKEEREHRLKGFEEERAEMEVLQRDLLERLPVTYLRQFQQRLTEVENQRTALAAGFRQQVEGVFYPRRSFAL